MGVLLLAIASVAAPAQGLGAISAHRAPAGSEARGPAAMGGAGGSSALDSARLLADARLIVPVAGVARASLRDSFDESRGAHRHEAIDIAAPLRTPVVAAGPGRIAKLFESVPGGHTLYQFDPAERFAYYYAHLDAYAPGVHEGMPVARGDLLGYVGVTGNAPPGAPHLHFAIFRLGPEKRWWQGEAVNPYPFLGDASAEPRDVSPRRPLDRHGPSPEIAPSR